MLALGIDTSNYATSLAVVDTASREVVCALKRLLPVEKGGRGLRQSEAVFHHTTVLPQLLQAAGTHCVLPHIGAVCVSERPRPVEGSYMPCFLPGVAFGAAFAAARGVALGRTSHQQGHLAAALHGCGQPGLKAQAPLFLHVSGGTTELLRTRGHVVLEQLGGTRDLYAGQAVDRLGVLLGYGFPAGEALSALALTCGEQPDPKVSVEGTFCHLSGLENQCKTLLQKGREPAYVARYCLVAIAKTLAGMLRDARRRYPEAPILCAGGVMASAVVRPYLVDQLDDVYFAPPALSADNAVGVALIGAEEAAHGTGHHGIGAE